MFRTHLRFYLSCLYGLTHFCIFALMLSQLLL